MVLGASDGKVSCSIIPLPLSPPAPGAPVVEPWQAARPSEAPTATATTETRLVTIDQPPDVGISRHHRRRNESAVNAFDHVSTFMVKARAQVLSFIYLQAISTWDRRPATAIQLVCLPLQTAPETGSRPTFTSPADVRAVFTDSACLARLDAGGVSLLMYPATELEAGPANLWLRRHGAGSVALTPLLGPGSPSSVAWAEAGPVVSGSWEGSGVLTRPSRWPTTGRAGPGRWRCRTPAGRTRRWTWCTPSTPPSLRTARCAPTSSTSASTSTSRPSTPIGTERRSRSVRRCRARRCRGWCSPRCARARPGPRTASGSWVRASEGRLSRRWRSPPFPRSGSSTSTRSSPCRTPP